MSNQNEELVLKVKEIVGKYLIQPGQKPLILTYTEQVEKTILISRLIVAKVNLESRRP